MDIDLAKLAAPFPPDAISWRVGSTTKDKSKGMALAYIDSRDVQNRLDEVCGPANWQVRFPWSDGKALACEIGIRINGEWVWKGDGAGATDVEADKGRFSDALKRAAVHWRIGRYLYDLDSPWVALEPAGNSYKIAAGEHAKLRALLAKDARQKPVAAPAEVDEKEKALKALAKQIRETIDVAANKAMVDSILKIRGDDLKSIKTASDALYLWIMEAVSEKDKAFAKAA